MGLILILPILVAGFIHCHTHPKLKLKLHRYEGQYLYLQVVWQGLAIFLYAVIFNFALIALLELAGNKFFFIGNNYIVITENIISSYFSPTFDKAQILKATWLIVISITMVLLPTPIKYAHILYNVLANSFLTILLPNTKEPLEKAVNSSCIKSLFEFLHSQYDVLMISYMSEILSDSPLDQMLFEANKNRSLIMLSLDDRKVYVGEISSLGEPNEHKGMGQEIAIVPFLSGYRNKDSLKVEFTTRYNELSIKNTDTKFTIVIKQEKITSLTPFDEKVYSLFQLQGIKYKYKTNTWSGKGRRPKWLNEYLDAGGSLDVIEVKY